VTSPEGIMPESMFCGLKRTRKSCMLPSKCILHNLQMADYKLSFPSTLWHHGEMSSLFSPVVDDSDRVSVTQWFTSTQFVWHPVPKQIWASFGA